MEIPKPLIEQIRLGHVILFLGAGASFGASHPQNNKIPLGNALRDILAEKYLSSEYKNHSLAQVAELAISETNLFEVQEFIAELFSKFSPNNHQKLIPLFSWKCIATTNYDLIVEKAYEEVKEKSQNLVSFVKNAERIESKLISRTDLMYLKLHGSIRLVNDLEVPLILTTDQYIDHKKHRSRLFERLKAFAYEFPILFVGYGLVDENIRAIIKEVFDEIGDAKPRSYLIDPFLRPEQIRLWEGKKITSIAMGFEDFLRKIDSEIPRTLRSLAPRISELPPIQRKFVVSDKNPSESLQNLLNRDVDYIHAGFKTDSIEPKLFYQGYFSGWSAIEMQLDAKRGFSDEILSEVCLQHEDEKFEKQELIVLRGHAGSGKSVLLKRIAWDAAIIFDKLCLFVKPSAIPSYEPLNELYSLCKQRIYLFIEPATDYVNLIENFLKQAKKDKLPLTILTTARNNEWNAFCETLESYETRHYKIKYLREVEIEELIKLLEKHKCLGHLEGLSFEEQKNALSEKAGRQLLVALHESTFGKPFQDIILDEYKNIPSLLAQKLYLSVSILHRLGVVTRAGVIARLHGISFEQFREKLFKPLDHVVFAKKHKILNDYEYVTRHPHIAEMVFETVLVNSDDRFHEYSRIIASLDPSYNADREAFSNITKAKHLKELFPDVNKVRVLYSIAKTRASEDPFLLQQEAIFEMSDDEGDLEKATSLLNRAYHLFPRSETISHSLAELSLRKAEKSNNSLEKLKLRTESRELAQRIISNNGKSSPAYHTIIKSLLFELEETLAANNSSIEISDLTRKIENYLETALQEFPDESFLLDADSRFNQILKSNLTALDSLKKAFQSNKKSSYIALRLSNMYLGANDTENAIKVLKEAIENNPLDKELNFKLAMIFNDNPELYSKHEIKHHLRNSFTKGDSRFLAQFWYARFLYLENNIEEASEIFNELKNANTDVRTKKKPRGKVKKGNKNDIFFGTVTKVEASYAFIKRDGIGDSVFVFRFNDGTCRKDFVWDEFETNIRVSFELAFTYYGAIALQIGEENKSF
jgi:tetratricopeptide (TPR) repeat protein